MIQQMPAGEPKALLEKLLLQLEPVRDEMKGKEPARNRGESSLRGHLKNEGKEESGSSAYVPREAEKDTQLQFAIKHILSGAEMPSAATTAPAKKG